MPINRTARIARTAHDKAHLNRLGVPEFGVVQIQIQGQGGSKSKSYRDGSSATPTAPATTGVDTFHFAPGPQYNVATWAVDNNLKDDVQIVYKLHNPQFAIATARLELFTRFAATPVWTRDLTGDELLHGEHKLQFNAQDNWDGKIDPHTDFPDQFLTVEYSPYKLKLTITGPGVNTSPAAWTYFHVIIGKLELEYGPKDVLPVQPANPEGGIHRDTYDDLITQSATPPAAGGSVKVFLNSDMFKTNGNQMMDNTLFTRYETLWGDGPQIPLFCKVWVKSSANTDIVAYKALGKLKFLWDWESTAAASATAFASSAENYLVNKTKPKGRNCHEKRGGKRASTRAVFPDQAGTAPGAIQAGSFPFQVEAVPTPRKWAAYSYAWNDGAAASKTGVIFQPARMAGDKYKVTVYVDQVFDRKKKYKLNVDTDAPLTSPAVLKAVTGDFQIWRRINLRKYIKKNGSVAETINMATVAAEYAKAFVELKDLTGGVIQNVAQGDWNNRETTAINGLSATRQRMIMPGDQYNKGGGGVYLRTRDQYIEAWMEEAGADLDALGLGAALTPALRAALVDAAKNNPSNEPAFDNAVTAAFTNHGGALTPVDQSSLQGAIDSHWITVVDFMADPSNDMQNDDNYRGIAKIIGKTIVGAAFDPDADANSGCTIFHCDKLHDVGSSLLGWAFDVTNGNGNRCGFLLCATQADHSAGDSIENTATHEFGHHFFLPHTVDAGERKNYHAHDESVTTCIMSYNVPTEFCGFCQLRLRGWDKDALKTKASKNSKT
ncbi:MAG TPA: hypothetical protein VG675_05465 [Bryobacteraceae bacterium]|nr:hypothetical protein [Bryobacteraceae bacterium]